MLKKILPLTTSVLVISALQITYSLVFAAIVFGQTLPDYLNESIAILLFGSVVSVVVLSLLSSYSGSMGTVQDIPIALSSVLVVSITSQLSGDISNPSILFSTSLSAMMLVAFITGVLMLLTARFNLGKLIRFIPYPVIGGLLASTGWIITVAGLGLMSGQKLSLDQLHVLLESSQLIYWIPGVFIALLLMWTDSKTDSPYAIPFLLLVCALLVHFVLHQNDFSLNSARESGWLLQMNTEKLDFQINPIFYLSEAKWSIIFKQFPLILSICLLSLVCSMIYVSSVEIAIDRELNMDRELIANGTSNLVISATGGGVAYHHISDTKLVNRLGTDQRLTGFIVAAVCLLPFFTSSEYLSYIPVPVLGGIILYLGFDFLNNWLLQSAKRLPVWEYLTILIIFFTVMFTNYAVGIGVGIGCGMLLFLIRSSTVNAVESLILGESCRSAVRRNPQQEAYLEEHENAMALLNLRGFLFFGSVEKIYDQIKSFMKNAEEPVQFLVIDFKKVSKVDSTSVMCLGRIRRFLEHTGTTLFLSNVPEADKAFIKNALYSNDDENEIYQNADLALEVAEGRILSELDSSLEVEDNATITLLKSANCDANEIEFVFDKLKQVSLVDGEYVAKAGDIDNRIFFIESGSLEVNQKRAHEVFRLRVVQAGTVIGEMSLYSGKPRSADLVAIGETIIYELTEDSFKQIEKSNPEIALKLHHLFAKRLANMLFDEAKLHALRV